MRLLGGPSEEIGRRAKGAHPRVMTVSPVPDRWSAGET